MNIFAVKNDIEAWGVWYALWFYGLSPRALWCIWCACRMIKREELASSHMDEALREHAEYHYSNT